METAARVYDLVVRSCMGVGGVQGANINRKFARTAGSHSLFYIEGSKCTHNTFTNITKLKW